MNRFERVLFHPHAEQQIADPKRLLTRSRVLETLYKPDVDYAADVPGRRVAESLNPSGATVTRVVYAETGPGEAFIITAHRVERQRSKL